MKNANSRENALIEKEYSEKNSAKKREHLDHERSRPNQKHRHYSTESKPDMVKDKMNEIKIKTNGTF